MWWFVFGSAGVLGLLWWLRRDKSVLVSDVVRGEFTSVLASVPVISDLAMGSLEKLAAAIQKFEGWFAGSRSQRNNNPGNLRYTSWTAAQGAVGKDSGGFAIFPSYSVGWTALLNLLRLRRSQHPDWTILDLFNSYAPPTENDTNRYAQFAANALGVPVNTRLRDLA